MSENAQNALSSIFGKVAQAQTTGGRYPFLLPGNHKGEVKDFYIILGGGKGDTAVLEYLVNESSNPECQGNVYVVLASLTGNKMKTDMSLSFIKTVQDRLAEHINEAPLTRPITPEEMAEFGFIGIRTGNDAPKGVVPVQSNACGIPLNCRAVQVLKKGMSLPMTDNNSYTRYDWGSVLPPKA